MARIFGVVGSEKALIQELRKRGVRLLHNLSDVENHLKNSDAIIENLKLSERIRISAEINQMKNQHREHRNIRAKQRADRSDILADERESIRKRLAEPPEETRNPFKLLIQKIRTWRDRNRCRVLEERFWEEVDRPLKELTNRILDLGKRIQYLVNNLDIEVQQRLTPRFAEKERIDRALEHVKTWISGARGEKNVVIALAELPDTFVVINDVNLRLNPPMKTPEGLRFHCQIDHVVVGPSGVFNIETKNWSSMSIENPDLRSPVEQIRFSGKALWSALNRSIKNRHIRLRRHHWGKKNIRVWNILAMAGAMPDTESQFVKILRLKRLKGYIEYFESTLGQTEIESISKWIIDISE